jgi:hypothetical protein
VRRAAAARRHRGPGCSPDAARARGRARRCRPARGAGASPAATRPLDLLAGVVATWAARLGRLDALTVDDRARGAGPASNPLAIGRDQSVIDLLEAAVVAERGEPAIDRPPGRQIARQQAPRAAGPITWKMPLTISRIGQARGRPVLRAGGR